MERLHFLHIRKTGGTAVKHALASALVPFELILHDHATRLRDIPPGERVFFFLRDPVDRFVSGFNSRMREGRPRYHYPWSEAERSAFGRFQSPDALASALGSTDPVDQAAAKAAMSAIRHLSTTYVDHLGEGSYLLERRADMFFIGRTEALDHDLERLCLRFGLPTSVRLPTDDIAAHRAPPGSPTALSPASKDTLRAFYRKDIELMALCERLAPADT